MGTNNFEVINIALVIFNIMKIFKRNQFENKTIFKI